MRLFIFITMLFTSILASAKDVSTTISEVEHENNAVCNPLRTSMSYCINAVCLNYRTFQCIGNTENFKVKLKVLTSQLADRTYQETVKKVIFIK